VVDLNSKRTRGSSIKSPKPAGINLTMPKTAPRCDGGQVLNLFAGAGKKKKKPTPTGPQRENAQRKKLYHTIDLKGKIQSIGSFEGRRDAAAPASAQKRRSPAMSQPLKGSREAALSDKGREGPDWSPSTLLFLRGRNRDYHQEQRLNF